jgi:hypothetical protein
MRLCSAGQPACSLDSPAGGRCNVGVLLYGLLQHFHRAGHIREGVMYLYPERGGSVVVKETEAGGKRGEGFDTTFWGHTSCYTNYSCIGLLVALVWWSPAWYSGGCCVCGVPLKVVSAIDSPPTTPRTNSAPNEITLCWLASLASRRPGPSQGTRYHRGEYVQGVGCVRLRGCRRRQKRPKRGFCLIVIGYDSFA